jgi:hypothetical protein
MMVTALGYLFLQIPDTLHSNATRAWLVAHQHPWAAAGMAECLVCLVAYIAYQIYTSDSETEGSLTSRRENVIKASISKGEISLVGALATCIRPDQMTMSRVLATETSPLLQRDKSSYLKQPLDISAAELKTIRILKKIVRPIFQRYDISRTGSLDIEEFACVMRDLHAYRLSKQYGGQGIHELFRMFDANRHGSITFHEFVLGLVHYMKRYYEMQKYHSPTEFTVRACVSSCDGFVLT